MQRQRVKENFVLNLEYFKNNDILFASRLVCRDEGGGSGAVRPPLPTPSTRRTRLWLVVLPIPDPESPPFPPPLPFPPFSLITRLLSEAGKPPVMPLPMPALALDFLATAVAARDIGYGSGRGLAAVAAFLLLLPVAALSNKTTTGDGGSLDALACRSVVVWFFFGEGEYGGGVTLNSQPWL